MFSHIISLAEIDFENTARQNTEISEVAEGPTHSMTMTDPGVDEDEAEKTDDAGAEDEVGSWVDSGARNLANLAMRGAGLDER